ncbi:hypothetical protein GR212_20460 [Rhizobium lusitanum]|uniref:Glycosyltransferase 99 N-terminal domain-containing protein n=1 Tax=Rhizobium lusitanum TaxID=293958 RepID=A0A6L9UCH3_9HYPH|nr:hypothetical protein [Rhizobium lusitanum]NEI71962.1 hypothetical protein [Rhizobium lusitanum]
MIKNILIYAEPHPIRNSFTEYYSVAKFMADMLNSMSPDLNWKLFSNEYVLQELKIATDYGERLLQPTSFENEFIDKSLCEWTEAEIDRRSGLTTGKGDLSDFYLGILKRLRTLFEFDAVLIWSENGAVRSFAKANGLAVFHFELGPTRSPFPETFYIDCNGTNGNSTAITYNLNDYPKKGIVPKETWSSSALLEVPPAALIMEHTLDWKEDNFPIPEDPFVVIALQLRDDLNTVDHSKFSSPKAFLEEILPPILGQGYKVFVKGHPGSIGRPINLVFEIEALDYARKFDNVEILDRALGSEQFIRLISKASAVCSINSSVCFEALLLGVPGLVYGDAAYDVGRNLKAAGLNFLKTGRVSLEELNPDRLSSMLLRHYFHPYRPKVAGEVLTVLLSAYKPEMTSRQFLSILVSNVSHGARMLDAETERATRYRKLKVLSENMNEVDNSILGHIDKVSVEMNGSERELTVRGWVGRRERRPAVDFVALIGDELGNPTDLFDRPDVKKVHPSLPVRCGFHITTRLTNDVKPEDFKLGFVAGPDLFWCKVQLGGIKKALKKVDTAEKKSEPKAVAQPTSLNERHDRGEDSIGSGMAQAKGVYMIYEYIRKTMRK